MSRFENLLVADEDYWKQRLLEHMNASKDRFADFSSQNVPDCTMAFGTMTKARG